MTSRRKLESLARKAIAGDTQSALELYLRLVSSKRPVGEGLEALSPDADYDGAPEAIVVSLMGQEVRVPAYPSSCDYVRIVSGGREVAYWNSDEWSESSDQAADVMGAIMGAIKSVMTGIDVSPRRKKRIRVLLENDDDGPTASITAFDPSVVGTVVLDGRFTDEGEGHYIALVSDRPDLAERLEELGFEVDDSRW